MKNYSNDTHITILMQSILRGYHPPINDYVPKIYRDLIESRWSQNPNDRPSFEYDHKGVRLQLNMKQIPKAYRNLIEKCWSQNLNDRPTFTEIVEQLKTNQEFITENINQGGFYEYINLVDKYKINIKTLNANEESNKNEISNTKSMKRLLNKISFNLQNEKATEIVERNERKP